MKNYKELIEECRNLGTTEDAWDRRNRHRKMFDEAGKDKEKLLEVAKLCDAEDKAEQEKEIYKKALRHNIEVAFITEMLPKICGVYQKYAGKRIGDKTKKKIRNEIREAINDPDNGYVSLDNVTMTIYAFHKQIYLYFGSYDDPAATYGKSCYKAYNAEGKLNSISPEMFSYNKKYIEDIPAYIEEKKALAEKLAELSKEIEKVREQYDDNLAEGYRTLDYGHTDTYMRLD